MKIPNQLNNCRFIHTNGKKAPTEKDWPRTKNYTLQNFTPQKTYGVLCGPQNLTVIDCDKEYIQDLLLQHEPFRRTFTVKTATKQLYHFYFTLDQPIKKIPINNKHGERVMDIQGQGSMVIGPGSTLENNNTYQIINDAPIQKIKWEYLRTILENIDPEIVSQPTPKETKINFPDFDPTCTQIKNKITIQNLLDNLKIRTEGNPGRCPLGHPSQAQKSFSYNKTLWNCFHCEQSGNIFQLYQKLKNTQFLEAKNVLMKLAGIQSNFKNQTLTLYADPKTKHQASELIAEEFKKLHKVYTIREDKEPEIYVYKNGIYVPEGRTHIKQFTRETLTTLYNEQFTKKIIDKIIIDTYIESNRFFTDEPPHLIPIKNGIYDTISKTLKDYNPKYKFFTKLPVIYDPLIKPDTTIKFMTQILKSQKDLDVIQEIMGYLFYRDNKYEKAFMFLGNGRNGKSKLIELFESLIGLENTTNISLKTLEHDTFSLSAFQNKYANFSPDLPKEVLQDTGNFKSLVGRDMINANRKFKSRITFKSYAKMVFATNNLPGTSDNSDGFFDRWILIDFPYKFLPKPGPGEFLQDPEIIRKIKTPQELTGLFNWAMIGLERIFKNGSFTNSSTADDIRNKWNRESSSFVQFWQDEIDHTGNITDTVPLEQLYSLYGDYCELHGLDVESTKRRRYFIDTKFNCLSVRTQNLGDRWWIVKKVKFKNVETIEVEE